MIINMTINSDTCTRCGLCAQVCPARAIDYIEREVPTRNIRRAEICISCGQCMAVCPSKSIAIGNMTYDNDFFTLEKEHIDYDSFSSFIASRRSIRNYKDKPVPCELLEQVVEAISRAPMGFPPHKTHLTIVQDRSTIIKMLPLMVKFFEDMLTGMKNPLIRYFIKRDAGPEAFETIQRHLIPIMKLRVPAMKQSGVDEITRGAPAMILFHAHRLAENHTTDATIAMTYGLLAAHALGLGASAIDLVPAPVNRVTELRQMLGIPENHEVTSCMILGYPRVKYQRAIKRELAGVSWI